MAQVPSFWHGSAVQGVTSQFVPEYPVGQVQVKLEPVIAQAPPLRHGAKVQGFISQSVPEYPVGHVQV